MAGRVIELCSRTKDWKQILTLILRDYGHPDCTNLFQNMGIILMALLLGCGNFITTVMLALNCGFDTDCTCATVGSIIGICEGAGICIASINSAIRNMRSASKPRGVRIAYWIWPWILQSRPCCLPIATKRPLSRERPPGKCP